MEELVEAWGTTDLFDGEADWGILDIHRRVVCWGTADAGVAASLAGGLGPGAVVGPGGGRGIGHWGPLEGAFVFDEPSFGIPVTHQEVVLSHELRPACYWEQVEICEGGG